MSSTTMEWSRAREVLEDFEQTLLAFMRKHHINHDQYRAATSLVVDSIKAGEGSLLFDVFCEAEATDIGNRRRVGSPEAIEGPFYLPGAPELSSPYSLPMRADEPGDPLFFVGNISDIEGNPVVGADLDIWHADADGLYANIHPDLPLWNLRGRLKTDAQGNFEVRTILPPPYEIPKDGPTGALLSLLGRHCFRPAHLHVKVRHPRFGEMTSQIYFAEGEYLKDDVANAVRDNLVAELAFHPEGDGSSSRLASAHYTVRYDFVLSAQ